MIEPKDNELLNREIDGENTPQESAEVRARVARLPELQAHFDGLLTLAQTLSEVGDAEPPPDLASDVMRSIRQRRTALRRVGWRERFGAAFHGPLALRYGLTFASGLALGVLVATLAVRSTSLARLEESSLTGTILSGHPHLLETLAREPLRLEGVQGRATTRLEDSKVLAEIELEARRAIDLAVEFDGDALTPLAFEQSGAGRNIVLSAHQFQLEHVGKGRYLLVLGVSGRNPGPLRLRLSGEGVSLERTLKTRREGP